MEDILSDYVCNDLVYLILSFAWPKKINVIRNKIYGRITTHFVEVSILEQACRWGHWNLAIEQIELFPYIFINNEFLRFIINCACKYGHAKLAEKLLTYDINFNVFYHDFDYNFYCKTILRHACKNDHIDVVKFILAKSRLELAGALEIACSRGYKDIAEVLLDNGATDFNRGLIKAVLRNHKNCAELMIEHGATNFTVAINMTKSSSMIKWLRKYKYAHYEKKLNI